MTTKERKMVEVDDDYLAFHETLRVLCEKFPDTTAEELLEAAEDICPRGDWKPSQA